MSAFYHCVDATPGDERFAPMPNDTPAMMVDSHGRHVPITLVKPVDRLRHELVLSLVERAKEASKALSVFKAFAFGEIAAFVELSAAEYGVHLGGGRGNVTLTSYCGNFRVVRAYADRLVFDERLQVAKELIDQCVRDWASDSRPEVRTLIEHAFQTDREGKVSTDRVLGLRRLDIGDERWLRAMAAISDSITIASTKCYVRFYERDSSGTWRNISLDVASAPFPSGGDNV